MKSIEPGGKGNEPAQRCDFHAMQTTQGLQWEAELPRHVVSISVGYAAITAAQQAFGSSFLVCCQGLANKRGGFAQRTASRQACGKVACKQLAQEWCRSTCARTSAGFLCKSPAAEFARLVQLALSVLFFWQTKNFLPDKNGRRAPRLGAALGRM